MLHLLLGSYGDKGLDFLVLGRFLKKMQEEFRKLPRSEESRCETIRILTSHDASGIAASTIMRHTCVLWESKPCVELVHLFWPITNRPEPSTLWSRIREELRSLAPDGTKIQEGDPYARVWCVLVADLERLNYLNRALVDACTMPGLPLEQDRPVKLIIAPGASAVYDFLEPEGFRRRDFSVACPF